MQLSPEHQKALLDVAREAIRRALREQPPLPRNTGDPILLQPAGCFVSLHERSTHRLRGCVGRLDANAPLIHVVQQTAVNVLGDPRFANDPVREAELPNLDIDISVLSPLEPATSATDFDLLDHGIQLTYAGRSGCFLPQVARETGWTKEQLLSRLCLEKLGVSSFSWRLPEAKLQRFTTLIVGPEPL